MDLEYWIGTIARALTEAGFLEPEKWSPLGAEATDRNRQVYPLPDLPTAPPESELALKSLLGRQRWPAPIHLLSLAAGLSKEHGATLKDLHTRILTTGGVLYEANPVPGLPVVIDTRPLAEGQRLPYQEAAYHQIEKWLEDLRRREVGEPTPSGSASWAGPEVEPDRLQQTLLIDGERGTGKTALLLTLVQKWNRAKKPAPYLSVALLDLDPLPPEMGMYAWLVGAFLRLVEKLSDAPGEGWCSGAQPTLRKRWEDLYRAARLGWSGRVHISAESREQLVAQGREADSAWLDLRRIWVEFMDELVSNAERKGLLLSGESLLVLGIDDLDLNDRQAGALLLGLRLLRHPRLAVVLTGHRAHLKQVLARELWSRSATSGQPLPLRLRRELESDADSLAEALIAKTLPTSTRMARFGLVDALRLAVGVDSGRFGEVSDQDIHRWLRQDVLPKLSDAEVTDLLRWLTDGRRPGERQAFTIRSVVHALGKGLGAEQRILRLIGAATDGQGRPVLEQVRGALLVVRGVEGWPRRFHVEVEKEGESPRPLDEALEFGLRAGLLQSGTWAELERSPLIASSVDIAPGRRVELGWPTPRQRFAIDEVLRAAGRLERGLKNALQAGERLPIWLRWLLEEAGLHSVLPAETDGLPELLAKASEVFPDWVAECLPVLAAPEYGLDSASQEALLAASWQLGRPWARTVEVLDRRRRKAIEDELRRLQVGGLPEDYLAKWPVPWNGFQPDRPWYDRPLVDGSTPRSLAQELYRPSLSSKGYLDLWAHRLDRNQYQELTPNWASRALDAEEGGGVSRAVAAAFVQVHKHRGVRSALTYFTRAWQLAVGESSDEAWWFSIAESGQGLAYQGPPDLVLRPIMADLVVSGPLTAREVTSWALHQGTEVLGWSSARVGWFAIMQSLLSLAPEGVGAGAPQVEEPVLLLSTRAPEVERRTAGWAWCNLDHAATGWRESLEAILPALGREPAQSVQRYLFARWILVQARAWVEHFSYSGIEFPVGLEDLRHLASHFRNSLGHEALAFRVWYREVQPELYLDPEALRFWRRGPHEGEDPVVPERTFADAMARLRGMDPSSLRRVVAYAATSLHRALARPDFAPAGWDDLLAVPGMDAWAVRCLRLWNESKP